MLYKCVRVVGVVRVVRVIIHYFYIYLTTNCCLGIVCYKPNCMLVLISFKTMIAHAIGYA